MPVPPLLRSGAFEDRLYQTRIVEACLRAPTLVILPTGLGKTLIAARVLAEFLRRARTAGSTRSRVLFLAPTKPLVEQHAQFLRDLLTPEAGTVVVATGEVAPALRRALWDEATVVVSTPQVVQNDLDHPTAPVSLERIALVIYDEAHRAVGNYAYVRVAEHARFIGAHALGITASPGDDAKSILAVCDTLGLSHLEVRTERDADVLPYVHAIAVETIEVPAPSATADVARRFRRVRDRCIGELQRAGHLRISSFVTKRDLLEAGERVRAAIESVPPGGRAPPELYAAISTQALAMKVNHAVELVDTQGIQAVERYFGRITTRVERGGAGAAKADRRLLEDPTVGEALTLLREAAGKVGTDHPKMEATRRIVAEELALHPEARIIVFTHYRDTADVVQTDLAKIPGARPVRFVGHTVRGEDRGLRQREQVETLARFRDGTHNILVATSVAEEGLDIPDTELVVFYEPVPDAIRNIQRRGRTGRRRAGRVVRLVTRGTKDQIDLQVGGGRERRMQRAIDELRTQLRGHITVGEAVFTAADSLGTGPGTDDPRIGSEESPAARLRRAEEDAVLDLARTPAPPPPPPALLRPPRPVEVGPVLARPAAPAGDDLLPRQQTTIERFLQVAPLAEPAQLTPTPSDSSRGKTPNP